MVRTDRLNCLHHPSSHPRSALSLFDFKGHKVRVVELEGEPWFVARDLYLILFGTTTSISARAVLGSDETRLLEGDDFSASDALKSLRPARGRPRLALLSESGLYKLVMRSDKLEARGFQDWVTKTVLPAIRKDGGYIAGEEFVATAALFRPFSNPFSGLGYGRPARPCETHYSVPRLPRA